MSKMNNNSRKNAKNSKNVSKKAVRSRKCSKKNFKIETLEPRLMMDASAGFDGYPFLITSTVSLLNAILPPSRSSNAALNVVSFFLNGSRIGVDLFLRSVSTSSSENSRLKNVLGIP